PFVAICCAVAVRFLGEWKYRSTAQLATGLTVSDDLIDNAKYLNPYEVQVTFNNLIEIISSRSVIGQVSFRLIRHDLLDSLNAFRAPESKEISKATARPLASYTPEFKKILDQKIH